MNEHKTSQNCEVASPIELGELSSTSLNLNTQVQHYGALLSELYNNIESIKPFPPSDSKDNGSRSVESGLVGEFSNTSNLLREKNILLEHIIQHLNRLL